MQLLFEWSAEGNTRGLGIIPGKIEPLRARDALPVPHMGWNTIRVLARDPLLDGIGSDDWFYFVHGYAALSDSEHTLAFTSYGDDFSSIVRQSNFWGVQFHPERSGKSGSRLLSNFLKINPCA